MKKCDILKETFVEFSQRTDINAYGKIFVYENPLVKFIWLIILLASLSLTAWVMSWNVLAYLEYGVVSQIGVVYETPTEFPAVTFCDNNPFTSGNKYPPLYDQPSYNNIFNDALNLGKMSAAVASYGDENRKLLGFNIQYISQIGRFSLDSGCLYNNNDCLNDLHWYWSYDYGNCFQFNTGLNFSDLKVDLKQSNRADSDYGLQISIFPLVNSQIITSNFPNGMVVFIHNASMRPLNSDRVFIKGGEQTVISVKRTFIKNVPSPYTQCQDLSSYSSDLYNFIVNSNKFNKYRQKDCFNLCIQQSIILKCNCSYSGFDNPFNSSSTVQPCLKLNDYYCFSKVFDEFNPNECASKSCPLECESIEYEVSMSSLVRPSYYWYISWVICNNGIINSFCTSNGPIDYEYFKSSTVSFTVYYPSLSYTQIETTPAMPFSFLLANLGGAMGLIVSFSVFTLFEITELILLIFHAIFFKKQNKKVKPESIQRLTPLKITNLP